MPFSRYLQSDERDHPPSAPDEDLDHEAFSSNVRYQIPNIISNAPAVPPGGGAEALPAGLYPTPWFHSHSFPPHHTRSVFFSSSSPTAHPHLSPSTPSSSSSAPYPTYHPHIAPSSSAEPHPAHSSTALFSLSSASAPAYALSQPPPPYPPFPASFQSQHPLSVPSNFPLPIYSASGLDLLSLLSRVHNRSYPKIRLGPVDFTCSFVITDSRRFDTPIGAFPFSAFALPSSHPPTVYASPSFLKLTGYDEHEVIGRNCRFLQAPGGAVQKGEDRTHTARDTVDHMRTSLLADKECQVSVLNYRKDGSAFINMVTIIPLRGGVHNHPEEADSIVYHVGFQVDLTEQPRSILRRLENGTYLMNYSDRTSQPPTPSTRDWRTSSMSGRGVSRDLRALLSDPAFISSFPLSSTTHASTAVALTNTADPPAALDPYDGNKPLNMFLLSNAPDFLHVVSLKGAFLYVAPAVRDVLGYDPDELVGRSLTDFCHPADCVPLTRELKEASATPTANSAAPSGQPTGPVPATGGADSPGLASAAPRPVDLLFRIQAKGRGYVWVECRGRLHVEPGKGRKAIILSGRARTMPALAWGPVARAGGVVAPVPRVGATSPVVEGEEAAQPTPTVEREFWGLLSPDATFLHAGTAVRDVLGWGVGEVLGKRLADFVVVTGGSSAADVSAAIDTEMGKVLAGGRDGKESAGLACNVHTKDCGVVAVHVVLYRSHPAPDTPGTSLANGQGGSAGARTSVVCQIKLCDTTGAAPATGALVHAPEDSVFAETALDRESSWQYELTQLKFRNQRLVEEVVALEASIAKKLRKRQASTAVPGRTPRTSFSYQPPSPPTADQASPSTPLNVAARYPPDVQAMAPALPPSHPTPVAAQVQSSFLSAYASHMARQQLPPPHPQVHAQPQGQAQAMARRAQPQAPVPHISMPPPPLSQHSQQQQQQRQAEAELYAPRTSTDSALQGWSSYNYAFEALDPPPIDGAGGGIGGGGGGGGGGGMQAGPAAFKPIPRKRSWDASFRDSGGGGGVGAVGEPERAQ